MEFDAFNILKVPISHSGVEDNEMCIDMNEESAPSTWKRPLTPNELWQGLCMCKELDASVAIGLSEKILPKKRTVKCQEVAAKECCGGGKN